MSYHRHDAVLSVVPGSVYLSLCEISEKPYALLWIDEYPLPQVLSELTQASEISTNQEWQIHSNLTELHDLLGACERILRTPIPVAYTRHTTRFLIIWLTVLPFALYSKFGIATLAVAPLIALLLAGINEIGIDVEEPFSLLPLESIADRAAMDCNELISTQVRFLTVVSARVTC